MCRCAADPAPCGLLRTRFASSEASVRRQIDLAVRTCTEAGICEAVRNDLAIILGEVLNNIVEHSADGPDGRIGLSLLHDGTRLSVETRDRGRPLPPQLLAGARLPDANVEISDLPEGGFGWFIIHSLAKDMVFERAAGINHLTFCLPCQETTAQHMTASHRA